MATSFLLVRIHYTYLPACAIAGCLRLIFPDICEAFGFDYRYGNGDYGIYACQSVNGQFDHSFAAGQPDSGFYIGACHPCHALITNVISEDNALGFSGTNAGGDLVISDSLWRNTMGGIVPNTLDSEPGPPQDSVAIISNLVENNNNYHAPAKTLEYSSIGNGIMLVGGINDVVKGNRVSGQKYYCILLISLVLERISQVASTGRKRSVIPRLRSGGLEAGCGSVGRDGVRQRHRLFS